MKRDFTYIDDIVAGTIGALERISPYEVFNIGNSRTEELMDYVRILEDELGMKAEKEMLPMQPGDVAATAADINRTKELLGFNPKTPVEEGIKNFVKWYREYYSV